MPEFDTTPQPKNRKTGFIILLTLVAFLLGVAAGRADLVSPVQRIFVDEKRELAPQEVDWQLLWDAISEIQENYVGRPVNMLDVLYGAVRGAVAALDDPYSVFLPPKEAQDFKDELEGNFEGIGAEIAIKNGLLVIVSPLDDSPALNAGLRPGDYIQKIDDLETADLSLEEAVGKIRGPAGTAVTLTVFHRGESEPLEVTVTRARIEVRSLTYEIREYRGRRLGYIALRRFGNDTPGQLEQAAAEFLTGNADGIILDVRNNPGGFLETAVKVSSYWVPRGQVVLTQQFGDGSEEVFRAEGANRLAGLPTVVLINGGSASASEIVAGALRDHGLAQLVGEKTFGKGSVQELINLRGQGELKLTVAKWLTPSGHDLNQEGLEPDMAVELTDEDFENDRDPQLDRALELLTR